MRSVPISLLVAVTVSTALACAKQPEIAPEAAAVKFTTTAPVPEVLDASVAALEAWAEFSISRERSQVYALHKRAFDVGYSPHLPPRSLRDAYRSEVSVELVAFTVTAAQVGDSTQVRIMPRRGDAWEWLPLGEREVGLAQQLATRIQRELRQARS